MNVIQRQPEPTLFGRIYASDPRDMQHPMRKAIPRMGATLRIERHHHTGAVLDQGNTPQCVGYTGEQFLSSAPYMMRKGRRIPSGTSLYHGAQAHDEWPGTNYAGTSGRGLMRYLLLLGEITEYVWAQRIEDVRDFILTRGPVCVGSDWYSGMSSPRWVDHPKTGGVRNDAYVEPTGHYQGGHEYLFIGYSRRRHAFRLINSWGPYWGENGRAWMAYDVANHLIFAQNGDAVSALERIAA